MDKLTRSQWNARCAARLSERWRTVPVTEFEVAAIKVWRHEELHESPPDETTTRLLSPVGDL